MFTVDAFPETMLDPNGDLNERFTIRETEIWCQVKAATTWWDLDVAACEEAHLANEWYDKNHDGLKRPWTGKVWCNPPWSDIEPWVKKAWKEFNAERAEVIAMLLPANRTEQPWWQKHVEPYRDRGIGFSIHFLPGRTKYGHRGNRAAVGCGSPPFGSVLLVWRQQR